jgi:tape measure domain-containing protein
MATRTDILQIRIERDGDGQLHASLANIEGDLQRLDGKTKSIAASTGTLRTAIAGLTGVISAGAIISTIVEYERLEKTLQAVEGSAGGARVALDAIKGLAQNSPFQVTQLTESYIKLKAFGLDPLDGTMQALIDQSSKLGGSQETLNGIVLAVGQAYAKQKLQGEEILQLVERGVPVWDLLSKALGKTAAELQSMSEKGQLGRREIALLIQEIGGESAGAALEQMDTLGGVLSNLQDAAANFAAALGEAGLSRILKSVANLLNYLATEGKGVAGTLLPILTGLIAARTLGPIFTTIGASAIAMARNFTIAGTAAAGLRGVLSLLGGPVGLVIGVATALTIFATNAEDASASTAALSDKVAALTGNYQRLQRTEITKAITEITQQLNKLQEEIKLPNTDDPSLISTHLDRYNRYIPQIKTLTAALATLQETLRKLDEKGPSAGPNLPPPTVINDPAAAREAEQQAKRLEQFRRSLLTEKEALAQAQFDKLALLHEFHNQGKIDAQEYFDELIRIESQSNTAADAEADKERDRQAQRLEQLRRSQLTEQQQIIQNEYDKLAIIDELNQRSIIGAEEYFAELERLEAESAHRRAEIEAQVNQTIYQSRANVYSNLAALFQAFAGKSRTAALAALAIEKALGISQVLIDSEVAAVKARAALIVPGDPSSVLRAEAAAQTIRANGFISAGLIGATGLAQASQIGGGGAASGSAANPVYTQPSGSQPASLSQGTGSQSVVNLNFYGNTYGLDDFEQTVGNAIKSLTGNDEILIDSQSRNGLVITTNRI